jgi:hypothetical protein
MLVYVFSTRCSPVVNFKTLKLLRIGISPIRETSLLLRVLLSMQCSGVFLSSMALCCYETVLKLTVGEHHIENT